MLPLIYARRRVALVLEEIARLKDSDFPYSHSRDALQKVEVVFKRRLQTLAGLTEKNDPAVVQTACSESLLQVFTYLPLLGFVLRSTNIRNSFEIFGPLLRLSRQILGPDTRLILSSEWNYSPHVYNPIPDLPNYVLLGLPASESGNPLLVPLAGHELGHTTWKTKGFNDHFSPVVNKEIERLVKTKEEKYKELFGGELTDLFVAQNLAPAHYCAMRQIEESFCDFLGLRLFSESYLFAFAYLLAPGGGERSALYPCMSDRVAALIEASQSFGVLPPSDYLNWFTSEHPLTLNDKETFLLGLADAACQSLIKDLIQLADSVAESAKVPERSNEKIEKVEKAFQLLTPASSIGDITNIMNAAWNVFHNDHIWETVAIDRIATLNELVLKSIEILEFEARTT